MFDWVKQKLQLPSVAGRHVVLQLQLVATMPQMAVQLAQAMPPIKMDIPFKHIFGQARNK